jgi:hypothetical protein
MKSSVLLLLIVLLLGLAPVGVWGGESDDDEDNPHDKMTRSKSACIDCHTKLPKTGEHAPDYFLVDTPSEHCLGCHDENEHVGVPEHIGKDAAPLPGDENGKIACFTCHDPHPGGVLEGRKVYEAEINEQTKALMTARDLPGAVERRESKQMFGALLRFPIASGEGCRDCHAATEDPAFWKKRLLRSTLIRVLPRY